MEDPEREPPFGVLLLACCMVLVQGAVAITVRHPAAWTLAIVDLGLAIGLLARRRWARWATVVRCAALLLATLTGLGMARSRRVAWPPVLVAVYGVVWLVSPAGGRWFLRPGGR